MVITYGKWLLALVLSVIICYIGWDYGRLVSENNRLKSELGVANDTIKTLDAIAKKKVIIQKNTDRLIEQIEKESVTDDVTAPVLLNAIKRLR